MPDQTAPTPDVTVANHGSIFTFELETDAALDWWIEHVPDEGFQMSARSKVVEHRFAQNIAEGMQADGLVVS